jgi:hypothetical protein
VYFALVYYPDGSVERIDAFRRKYDPTVSVIEAHMGIMFPVPGSIGLEKLGEHLERTLWPWSPFSIRLSGLTKSHDHWLLLTIDKGRTKVIQLFEQIYTGPLAEHRRYDIEFIPHIGLGLFIKNDVRYTMSSDGVQPDDLDEPPYRKALKEAQSLNLELECVVNKLDLVELPTEILDWAMGKRADFPKDKQVVTRREFILPLGGKD